MAFPVPTPNVSVVDLTARLNKGVSSVVCLGIQFMN
jgi:glyceraldehyde-3-phosphate dehydrogenase/erythrose-4-phosphate dehydrogenase